MRAARWAVPVLVAALLAAGHATAQKSPPAPPEPPERVELDFREGADTGSADFSTSIDTTIGGVRWTHEGSSGDLVRFGENVVVRKGQRVRGDVVAVGGSVDVYGTVDGDAVALGGRVRIRPGGQVRGEAISLGGRVIHETQGGLGGSSVSLPAVPPWFFDFNFMNMVGQGLAILKLLFTLGLTLLLGWVATHVAPERTLRAVAYVRERPGPAFLWGLGALIGIAPSALAIVLVGVILCITIIGIPVAALVWLGYAVGLFVLLMWGYFIGAAVVGAWVVRRLRPQEGEPTLWRAVLFGVLTLFAPAVFAAALRSLGVLVPVATGLGVALSVFNVLLSAVVAMLGVGSVLVTRAGVAPRLPAMPVPVEPPPAPPAPPPSWTPAPAPPPSAPPPPGTVTGP